MDNVEKLYYRLKYSYIDMSTVEFMDNLEQDLCDELMKTLWKHDESYISFAEFAEESTCDEIYDIFVEALKI